MFCILVAWVCVTPERKWGQNLCLFLRIFYLFIYLFLKQTTSKQLIAAHQRSKWTYVRFLFVGVCLFMFCWQTALVSLLAIFWILDDSIKHLVIGVMSERANFLQREAIRKSWLQNAKSDRLVSCVQIKHTHVTLFTDAVTRSNTIGNNL